MSKPVDLNNGVRDVTLTRNLFSWRLALSIGFCLSRGRISSSNLEGPTMNRIVRYILCSLFFVVATGSAAIHAQEASAMGTWLTQKSDGRIQVSRCGQGICGKVVWLKDAVDPTTGKPMTDSKNPNPTLAARPMVGVQLFINMNPTGPTSWAGRIYNADDGGTYESKVKVTGADTLYVEGCLGAFCGGETWTKFSAR
jgi:uncharacterized protein (DUF2147 family)